MVHFIEAHQLIVGIGAYFIYSNAVQALQPPEDTSSAFYHWFFGFAHGLAGNIKYALQKAVPQYVDPSKP